VVEQVKDFRGNQLEVGYTVAWTVGVSEMRLGIIDSFTPKCARVLSLCKDGSQHPLTSKPPIYIVDPLRIVRIDPS
jgi:hypothetical protein